MRYPINYKDFSPKVKYYSEMISVYNRASSFLTGFDWCRKIVDVALYTNLGSKLGLYLFKIDNSASSKNAYLWVIAGDLPMMYLNVHEDDTTREVLKSYTELASDWVQHVKNNQSLENCYPFDANPTLEMADLLERRVNILNTSVIDNIDNIKVKLNLG